MRRFILLAAAVLGIFAGCSDPNIREYQRRTGIVQGTVFYPNGSQRGNVIVLLFRANDPPPPTGTGRPVNFIVVPKKALFGDAPAGLAKDFTADFTIPTVPPGTYQIRAFLDADEDFNPIYDLLAQPTAGDVGGGYVDTTTGEFISFEIKENQVVGSALVALAVNIPVERPAFAITSTATFTVPLAAPARLTIESHPIQREQVKMDPRRTAFLVTYADDDKNGTPDDVNGDHLPDVYPRVLLRRRTAEMNPTSSIVVPLIIDPLPFQDALRTRGSTLTTRLNLIIPPVAVEIAGGMRTILPAIPAGDYDTIVISGTGQTWQVPNNLDEIQPGEMDPTQSVIVKMISGAPPPAGTISGTLRVTSETEADGYVVLFRAEDPPPPAGTGRPIGLASVPRAAFMPVAGGREAPFVLRGVPAGNYLVSGLYDADNNFSPLVTILAQASEGDLVGVAEGVVTAGDGEQVTGVTVSAMQALPFERPAFSIAGGPVTLQRRPAGQFFEIEAHPIEALGMDPEKVRFPVAITMADQESDNFRDLLPRVILTKMIDGGDPRVAPDDPQRTIIPALVDPIPYTSALSQGTPIIPAERLRVIVPPAAVQIGPGGMRTLIAPIPPGRYRVNVLSPFGQTWSVPNDLDYAFSRRGTPLEDATQAGYVQIANNPLPPGAITGTINLATQVPEDDFQVIVLAFDKNNPPPPAGSGRPLASALVSRAAFNGTTMAPYVLGGLPAGTYQVRAYLDANDNFTPWFDTHNQPTNSDVGGGYLMGLALGDVQVIDGPVTGINVTIAEPLRFTTDRPVFTIAGGNATLDRNAGPVQVRLTAEEAVSPVLQADGVFPVRWIDSDGDGDADDINGDGNLDVYPIVVAELLDPNDPTHLTPAQNRILIFGYVSPAQFAPLGFPAGDPMALNSVVLADELIAVFPPIGVDAATSRPIGLPPAGNYRINVVSGTGQTWTIPNVLQSAIGDPLATTQSRYLIVE